MIIHLIRLANSECECDLTSGHANYCNFHIDDLVPRDSDDGKDFEEWDIDDHLVQMDGPFFLDEEQEELKRRRCHLLKLDYKKPLTITEERFDVTRYSNGPLEKYAIMRKVHHDDWLISEENVAWLKMNCFVKMSMERL
ncbi:hypothetical protein Tco_1115109 [Tanacetum coccineum]